MFETARKWVEYAVSPATTQTSTTRIPSSRNRRSVPKSSRGARADSAAELTSPARSVAGGATSTLAMSWCLTPGHVSIGHPCSAHGSCGPVHADGGGHHLGRLRAVWELRADAPVANDDDPVAHREHLGQVGRDHEDADALRHELVHQAVDLELRPDVHAARRLVEDQHPGPRGEPLRQHDLL